MAYKRFTFDEQAFLANYALFKTRSRSACGAVVKANAYGTGARRVVQLLHQEGCQHFFVATPREGIVIRDLTTANIYVLSGPLNDAAVQQIAEHKLIPVLNTPDQLKLWESNREFPCAIHVDTGMQRLGFDSKNLDGLDFSSFNVCLLITHLACADQPDHPQNEVQIAQFERVKTYFPNTPTSVGNSAAILNGERFQGDVVRPGIGLYGGNPFVDQESPVKPVCTLEGQVLQIREVEPDSAVGYGASFITSMQTRIAVVGIGYADGISLALSNNGSVAFGGQRMPIIGKVTMDAIHVDCTQVTDLKESDFVELIGPTISVDEVAATTNTIAYEVLTQVGNATVRD
ncbi:MAG: alanine racemase [Gammaproteobacteria bacterium]|nr:alanine racemase [Gammaproteobacteria bacterium]MYF03345.1 alanine racemase [Gammaproteobacteria bacterium]MYI77129.1 alanine racemase [Gammaproteobacteria bacterium]